MKKSIKNLKGPCGKKKFKKQNIIAHEEILKLPKNWGKIKIGNNFYKF